MIEQIRELIGADLLAGIVRALIILIAGFALARLAGAALGRFIHRRGRPQQGALIRRVVTYGIMAVAIVTALKNLGFDMTVFLGAAGILTVALGFASQTTASNFISGLFLIGERPFESGDVITVDGITGEVVSIDLLSVKLRTFDNLKVRVPNESLFKSRITNLSFYPIRRYDLLVGVAYKEDIGHVRDVLFRVADEHPLCLDEPRPLVIFQGFGESSINLQFSVWGARPNYIELRNTIPEHVKEAFDAEGIEIPFPHRTLYAGSRTEPLPIRLVNDPPADS